MEWILGGGGILVFVSLIGFVFHNNVSNDRKVNRVYRRLDEVKELNDKKYQQVNVCEILHKQLRDDLTEIKSDVKLILKNGHNK